MAESAVKAAIDARLASLWSRCVVLSENTDTVAPADGAPFLLVEYPLANADQISIGSPGAELFRETGAIRFVLTIATGSGLDWALGWLDELRALFRAKQFSSVTTWAPSSPTVDDRNAKDGFLQLSCTVPYHFDFIS